MEKKEISKYIDNLKHYEDSPDYLKAEEELIRLGERSLPFLHDALLNHPSAIVRKTVLTLLLFLRDESTLPFLARVLAEDKEYDVKAEAIKVLGEMQSLAAHQILIHSFTVRENHLGQDLVFTLARKYCLESIANMKLFLKHTEDWVRERAAICIHYMNCEKTSLRDDLIAALISREFTVRDAMITALADREFDSNEQMWVLSNVVENDEDSFVRENALSCLKEIQKRNKTPR